MITAAIWKFIVGLFFSKNSYGEKILNIRNIIISALAIAIIALYGLYSYNAWQARKANEQIKELKNAVKVQDETIKKDAKADEAIDKVVLNNSDEKDKIVKVTDDIKDDKARKIKSIEEKYKAKLSAHKVTKVNTVSNDKQPEAVVDNKESTNDKDKITELLEKQELEKQKIEEVSLVQITSIWDNYCSIDKSDDAQQNCKKENKT